MELAHLINNYLPIVIIILTVITSINGFNNMAFFDRFKFSVGAILGSSKQWDRLVTSAFLHGDFMHLIFNMMTLYFFSDNIINGDGYYSEGLGAWRYMVIYFGSIIGGGLLSLWMHRKEYHYSAIGASGGVVGILFAAIALNPHIGIHFFFIPIAIPGWIFGILYILYSIYGMRTAQGNIGHDAHLGGAAIGLLITVLFRPDVISENGLYIGLMTLPLIVLAVIAWNKK